MCASDTFKISKLESEVERLEGLLATGAGCEEGYRQHYADLLNKCESARIAAETKALQCEERMFRYGEQAKLTQEENAYVNDMLENAHNRSRLLEAKLKQLGVEI